MSFPASQLLSLQACQLMNEMKFLFLATELFNGIGGIQVFNNHLVRALLELGHSTRIVSMNDSQACKLASLPASRSSSLSACQLESFPACKLDSLKALRKPMFFADTLKTVFCFKPDIILCGHVNYSPFCIALSKAFKIPYFTITHGIEVWSLKRSKLFGLKHSNKILSVSQFTKNKILNQLSGYPEKDISILHDTFDPERFKPKPKPVHLMEKWGIKKDDKVLLTIARLSKTEKYKGYDKVIEVLGDVIEEVPNVKYIIGGYGDDTERIKRVIRDSGLGDKIILTGFIPHEEVVDYYNLCDVFVMPSKGEGFGIVFLEALACGKPVIAGNHDASPEAVLSGELGILVDPDNVNEIKEAIVSVLKREVPEKLLDSSYLRQRIFDTYGYPKFKERLERIITSAGSG